MIDIVIIGAGTAGLTAAIYAARAGKSVTVLEENAFGGQITYSPRVENYPGFSAISGMEFADRLISQALGLGISAEAVGVSGLRRIQDGFAVVTEDGDIEARAVILATGVKPAPLGVLRETELVGAGVSYCAVCDGAFYKGKSVAVVGGGNTALQDALYLSDIASNVTLIHRRSHFRGDAQLVEKVCARGNVNILTDSIVAELVGERELRAVKVKNLMSEAVNEMEVEGLFIAAGHIAVNEPFRGLVKLDEHGFVSAGEDCRTNETGIFAAGDCRTKEVRQLTTAAADGAVAATNACKYLDYLCARS